MTDPASRLLMDYMVYGHNIGSMDVSVAVDLLTNIDGGDIIDILLENKNMIRPIATGEIPQFSEEKDVYNVLRVLIDSGIDNMTYEQIGVYLCAVDAKYDARRKYGENHYKFSSQLGLATKERPLSATEMGVAYYLLENDSKRQALMNRLVFSIPFVQHAILRAVAGRYNMTDYLAEFLSHSTVLRRRSNMRKIMLWAYEITRVDHKQLFDNIAWY